MAAAAQPSGQVTLVFSDIEGSTRLLDELGMDAYRDALAEHRRIVCEACRRHSGYEVDYEGDAFFYAFSSAHEAVSAVSEAMAGLEDGPIRIRVGIHTGTPGLDPPKYVGMDVHFAARVMSSAHGGQVVVSAATAELVQAELYDLGEHRLKDIAEAVPLYQLGDGSFPPLKTISNTNLPRPASSFLGREAELAHVLSRLEGGARLLTLTGPGGTGKTRLALEAASSLVPSYKAGVFWVGLATLRDPALVLETIAQTLGANDGLAAHIGERELLLLLDNLEQVIEAAPELASLLSSCPNLTLLVTSRELLRVQGEVEYPVPPLAAPEAVSLFCERAQIEPSTEIAELCAHLDSLPLAVELAAARTKALSPAQILERLSQRLDLLKGGRDADPRQQTLRATIEWSYELLSPEEQQLFTRLSVFAGGCTLEAAEEVADADLDTVQSLVEKSLLRFSNDRYWMLETIREYAGEGLQAGEEEADLRDRHARSYLLLAEGVWPARRSDETVAIAALDAELGNMRRALQTLRGDSDSDAMLRLAAAMGRYWYLRSYVTEGRMWLQEALTRSTDSPTVRAKALLWYSAVLESIGEYEESKVAGEASVELYRRLDDDELAYALNSLASVASNLEDFVGAQNMLEESLVLGRELGDTLLVTSSLVNMAALALTQHEYERADVLSREALPLIDRLQIPELRCIALQNWGNAHLGREQVADAARLIHESLLLSREIGRPELSAGCLVAVARLIVDSQPLRAATLLGSVEAIRDATGVSLQRFERELVDAVAVVLDEYSDPTSVHVSRAEGSSFEPNDAVERALEYLD